MSEHAAGAETFRSDQARAQWHDRALWNLRTKRDHAADAVPEWEILCARAKAIKSHTLSRLGDYLEEFEANATRLGAQVHWARNAAEHNRIVLEILKEHGVWSVVKSKSMLTEECQLNPFLEGHGISVTDTDLGEWIVQLRKERPSHIVLPAIHLRKEDVAMTFEDHLGRRIESAAPNELAGVAREELRQRFFGAQAGITGVNFAVAETGGFVVCTNEGNADLGTAIPPVHIACMGIEKVIPQTADLAVFLRLLARSATGQPITAYTSHFNGPAPNRALHIVMVDNGRSHLLSQEVLRPALGCIRCGACLNTCPVYRRSGGHSYEAAVPGPIGSVLEPSRSPMQHASLPYACTLCGSCSDVCPVGIDLDKQLLAVRADLHGDPRFLAELRNKIPARMLAYAFSSERRYARFGKYLRRVVERLPKRLRPFPIERWNRNRDLPEFPQQTFRQLMAERNKR